MDARNIKYSRAVYRLAQVFRELCRVICKACNDTSHRQYNRTALNWRRLASRFDQQALPWFEYWESTRSFVSSYTTLTFLKEDSRAVFLSRVQVALSDIKVSIHRIIVNRNVVVQWLRNIFILAVFWW